MIRKFRWYFARLSSMSLPEVSYRIDHLLKSRVDRRRISQPSLAAPQVAISAAISAEVWLQFQRESPSFYFSWQERDSLVRFISQHFPDEFQATLQTAQELLAHRILLFGRLVSLGDSIRWQCDPISGKEWPAKFWADIDTRDSQRVGGVKWVWELNRHHHLVTLAKAYFLSGEEQYAEEVCVQLMSWIEANPRGIGVNWSSPLEMALRMINWSWALAFVRHSAALTQPRFNAILQSVAAQAQHIERYLSAHSSANNHLIGEAAGLAVAGIFFPALADAERWRNQGIETLTREITLQIHPDGVPAEQATHYLTFVLDFYLLVWRLCEANGHAIPSIWRERLGAACTYLRHLMDQNGHVPHIGDSDDAWVVRLDDRAEANNFQSILASAAALLRGPDFKSAARQWDEKSHWLLGTAGHAQFTSLPVSEQPSQSHLFEQGGACVMASSTRLIVFDCGSLGYLSTAAHGHADALSLTVSVDGVPLLIDPGTYAYQEGGDWRTYFRSTAAHNTVVVDGENQSEMQGTFLWGRKANTKLLYWHSTPAHDIAVAEHDGYAPRGLLHRRTVIYDKPDWLFVIDRLTNTTPSTNMTEHTFEQLWHFPAGSVIEPVGNCHRIAIGDRSWVMLPIEMPEIDVRCYDGLESPIQGWVSERYSQLASAPVLGFSGNANLPVKMITAIALRSSSTESKLETEIELENSIRTLHTKIDMLEQQVHL